MLPQDADGVGGVGSIGLLVRRRVVLLLLRDHCRERRVRQRLQIITQIGRVCVERFHVVARHKPQQFLFRKRKCDENADERSARLPPYLILAEEVQLGAGLPVEGERPRLGEAPGDPRQAPDARLDLALVQRQRRVGQEHVQVVLLRDDSHETRVQINRYVLDGDFVGRLEPQRQQVPYQQTRVRAHDDQMHEVAGAELDVVYPSGALDWPQGVLRFLGASVLRGAQGSCSRPRLRCMAVRERFLAAAADVVERSAQRLDDASVARATRSEVLEIVTKTEPVLAVQVIDSPEQRLVQVAGVVFLAVFLNHLLLLRGR